MHSTRRKNNNNKYVQIIYGIIAIHKIKVFKTKIQKKKKKRGSKRKVGFILIKQPFNLALI